MERFARKSTDFPVFISLTSTFTQRYLRCATRIGEGYCQQQFIRINVRTQDAKCELL